MRNLYSRVALPVTPQLRVANLKGGYFFLAIYGEMD
jgi:hypothetical protein